MTEPFVDRDDVRGRTRALCAGFPDEYWRETDLNRRYPQEFVDTLTAAGLLAVLIPTGYGGAGLGLGDAAADRVAIYTAGGSSVARRAPTVSDGPRARHGRRPL